MTIKQECWFPVFSGFNKADKFATFFINHLNDYNLDEIHSIKDDYNKNDQCTNRNRHDHDIKIINDYLSSKESIDTENS